MITGKAHLDNLFYEIGKQSFDFKVAQSYKAKDGSLKWSKWIQYIKAQEDQKFMEKVNNRQLLDVEVVIDLDLSDGETKTDLDKRFEKTLIELDKLELKYQAFFTGSKGYHIHLFFQRLRNFSRKDRERFREYFIERFSGDLQKKTDNCMIALEFVEHWKKTGNPKELIKSVEGDNDTKQWIEEINQKIDDQNKEKQNSSFVLDEKDLPQSVDHALGFIKIDGVNLRYYGAKLTEEIYKEKKGVQSKTFQKVNALILEDGRIISKYSKPDDLNFVFESEMGIKYNRWSLTSINQFIKGKAPKVSIKSVFEQFKESYDQSMVFEYPEIYELNSLWDLCTYFSDLLDKFPIIKHEGMSGTAKSKGMKISANQSFNGKKFLCPTPANFFRYRHNNKATLYIEEAERLFDDAKKKSSADSELVEYLNGSYEKGNTVPRQDKDNINITLEFDPAGFTRIGSIKPLMGALESRSIPFHMIKAPQNDKRGNVEIPAENDSNFQKKRDYAYVSGLTNYRHFMYALNNVKNNYNLANRQWLMAKPMIAMAHCIDPKLEFRIGNFIYKLYNVRDKEFDESSWENILAYTLIGLSCTKKDPFFISNETIKTIFLVKLRDISDQDYRISANKISRMMSDLGFSNFRCTSSDGSKRGYGDLDFFKISEILIRNEVLTIENVLKNVSNESNRQIADDKIHKWYFDVFDKKISKCVNVSNFSDNLTDTTFFLKPVEEKIEDNHPIFDIWHKCSFDGCNESPCAINSENKYFCQKHWRVSDD